MAKPRFGFGFGLGTKRGLTNRSSLGWAYSTSFTFASSVSLANVLNEVRGRQRDKQIVNFDKRIFIPY